MHAAKCVLNLNRNDLADSLDFDMNLKTNPTDMIQIGAYTKQSKTIWISWPWSFGNDRIDLRFENSNMGLIKDQRAKFGRIIWMTNKCLMV